METIETLTIEDKTINLDRNKLDELESQLRGDLITSESGIYDEARSVWNGLIDKTPAMVVRCINTGDVVDALNFARENNLLVAVRSGGHNVAGNAVCDEGIVIDLSEMKGIYVDPEARTARVQPGADWGDVDKETQVHGLITPGGQVSITGVAGLTLGGGMGYVRRKWGLTCDNLLSAEIVTADGEIVTASANKNEDLFWAIRGGGGNFGVVTSFEFQLHELGPEIYGALTIYPFDDAVSVLRNWRDFALDAPNEVTCDAYIWGMPPLPGVPAEMHWTPVVIIAGMYAGPVEEGKQLLQPASDLGTPIEDMSGPRPYVEMQSDLDPLFADGQLYYWKSLFSDRMGDELIDEVVAHAADKPSKQCLFALRTLGGAMSEVPEEATAYGNRDAMFNISIDNTWQDHSKTDDMIAWTRNVWSNLREKTNGGVYVNFAGFGEEKEPLTQSAHGKNYERLQQVKSKYDPDNFFRVNQNIVPSR
ncbi:MAG: FAD-binding protein [Bacteroidetes bacterium]|jgi:FAD/FMN-containing dehydrogenase|nr:FAD-binding protein [Bacteroidota bacterium]